MGKLLSTPESIYCEVQHILQALLNNLRRRHDSSPRVNVAQYLTVYSLVAQIKCTDTVLPQALITNRFPSGAEVRMHSLTIILQIQLVATHEP
jgi:hypothetical protein